MSETDEVGKDNKCGQVFDPSTLNNFGIPQELDINDTLESLLNNDVKDNISESVSNVDVKDNISDEAVSNIDVKDNISEPVSNINVEDNICSSILEITEKCEINKECLDDNKSCERLINKEVEMIENNTQATISTNFDVVDSIECLSQNINTINSESTPQVCDKSVLDKPEILGDKLILQNPEIALSISDNQIELPLNRFNKESDNISIKEDALLQDEKIETDILSKLNDHVKISIDNSENINICEDKNNIINQNIEDLINDKAEVEEIIKDVICTIIEDDKVPITPINKNIDDKIDCIKKEKHNQCSLTQVRSFDWHDYLEVTNSESTPPIAFLHVENSLDTGIKEGQYLEVLQENDESNEVKNDIQKSRYLSYWPARVISSCGLLLRLKYEGIDKLNENNEFWCDLSTKKWNLKPIGWSRAQGIPLKIPLEMQPCVESPEEINIDSLHTVAKEIFDCKHYEIFARIEEGDLLEVIDVKNPYEVYVAKVIKNHGGRLLLQYLSCDIKPIWFYFNNPRLRPFQWIKDIGEPYRYKVFYNIDNIAVNTSNKKKQNFGSIYKPIQHRKHNLEAGMYLEAVHPTSLQTIHVALIIKVIDDTYFEVDIDGYTWITTLDDPFILPINFCRKYDIKLIPPKDYYKNDFIWEEFLNTASSKFVPNHLFEQTVVQDLGFEVGQKLETVHPINEDWICIGTIVKIFGHILYIKIDADEDICFYRAASSFENFPAGWAISNDLSLHIPTSYYKEQEKVFSQSSQEIDKIRSAREISLQNRSIKEPSNQNSLWCDKLYINHCCYPGPYLSKTKIAKLSQSVGPGPVHLVLQEILGRTINTGYIPTRILKELKSLPRVNPSWQPTILKARYKNHLLKATVNIATTAGDVDDFLMEFSKSLMCCYNLWSFKVSGESCPYNCNGLNLAAGSVSNNVARGRNIRGGASKRKKGTKKKDVKQEANCEDNEKQVEEDYDDEEFGEDPLSGSEIEGTSRSSSPLLDLQKKCKQSSFKEEKSDDNSSDVNNIKRSCELDQYQMILGESINETSCEMSCKKKIKHEIEKKHSFFIEPADVYSDPIDWTITDVENYILGQPSISHYAVRFKEHEIDGRAFMLLNLPTLVYYLDIPHASAVTLAHHICRVNLAHFVNYPP